MVRRPWTTSEIETLRRMLPDHTAAQIAAALDRTTSSIHQRVKIEGLSRYRHADFGPRFEAFLRERHAQGWSDAEIAEAWRCDRHAVGARRRRLGLGCNTLSARRRERVRQKTAEQLRQAGVATLGELRVKVYRDRAIQAGWPADLRFRAVQILNTLWERGPMTRREIADAIGMPWKGSRKSLVSNDPEGSYLAHLMARGLVVCLGRQVRGEGKGRSVNLYSLPLDIQRKVG